MLAALDCQSAAIATREQLRESLIHTNDQVLHHIEPVALPRSQKQLNTICSGCKQLQERKHGCEHS